MPLTGTEAGAACALSRFTCFGAMILRRIFALRGSYEAAFTADKQALLEAGLSETTADAFLERRDRDAPERYAERLAKEGIGTLVPDDPGFPALLREIADTPAFLHYRGSPVGDAVAVAVVGTRRMSRYGREMTERIATGLAEAGTVVVSGLAIGIDAVAHRAAIETKGVTWAFLGSGLDRQGIYPPGNRGLADDIVASGGTVFSEFPPGMAGFKYIFPIRNRLIAGSTLGTVVIEATVGSGSLITSEAALRYDREVFAVPGDVRSEGSGGPHKLIGRGAKLVTNAKDILETFGFAPAERKSRQEPPEEARRVLELLSREPTATDDLARIAGLPAGELGRMLSMLEIGGWVKNAGGVWCRTY